MSFMSGIMDHSEGPVTQSMQTELKQVMVDAAAADEKFDADINRELAKLDDILK